VLAQAFISAIIGIIPKLISMFMAYSQGKTVQELEQVKLQNKALKAWAKHSVEPITPGEAYDWFTKKKGGK